MESTGPESTVQVRAFWDEKFASRKSQKADNAISGNASALPNPLSARTEDDLATMVGKGLLAVDSSRTEDDLEKMMERGLVAPAGETSDGKETYKSVLTPLSGTTAYKPIDKAPEEMMRRPMGTQLLADVSTPMPLDPWQMEANGELSLGVGMAMEEASDGGIEVERTKSTWTRAKDKEGRARPIIVFDPKQESWQDDDLFKDEFLLPLGFVCQGVQQATRDDLVKRGCADFILTLLFVVLILLVNPVSSAFEIQDGISQSLARASIPIGNVTGFRTKKDFHTIKSYDEFWSWANAVLYPEVYNNTASASGYGKSNAFSIARYNRLVTPIRFRQMRVKKDSCDAADRKHILSWPCWSGTEVEELGPAAVPGFSSNSTFHADGLSALLLDYEDLGTSLGSSGHVVDLELDPVLALSKLQGMAKERWTDEWTKAVAVDVNTYNANYDIATVVRFKVVRALGGQLTPNVETCSCSLNPTKDLSIKILGILWLLVFLLYTSVTVYWWCRKGLRQSFRIMRAWLQLFYIAWFFAIIVIWAMRGLLDSAPFRSRHPTQFQDMYTMCHSSNVAASLGALPVLLACLQLVRTLKVFPVFSNVCEVLAHAVSKILPFTLAIFVSLVMFGVSTMWLFGARVHGLHTWYHAFGILFHSLTSGTHNLYVFAQMSDVNSSLAGLWMIAWVLLSTLVVINMFVALMTSSIFTITKRMPHEQMLEVAFPPASFLTYLKSKAPRLWKDPDIVEVVRKLMHEVRVWKAHLKYINIDTLQSVTTTLVAQGKTALMVKDVMKLFPHPVEEESYKRAAGWMQSLSVSLGVKMQDELETRTTALEVNLLTQGFCKLEEEIYGLGHQLRRVIPNGAPKARVV